MGVCVREGSELTWVQNHFSSNVFFNLSLRQQRRFRSFLVVVVCPVRLHRLRKLQELTFAIRMVKLIVLRYVWPKFLFTYTIHRCAKGYFWNEESYPIKTDLGSIQALPKPPVRSPAVWPDLAIFWTLGNFLKPLAAINLPKSPTFLGKFCKGVKIFHFSSEIIFRQLL